MKLKSMTNNMPPVSGLSRQEALQRITEATWEAILFQETRIATVIDDEEDIKMRESRIKRLQHHLHQTRAWILSDRWDGTLPEE